jgi:hypothetical protein
MVLRSVPGEIRMSDTPSPIPVASELPPTAEARKDCTRSSISFNVEAPNQKNASPTVGKLDINMDASSVVID